MKQKAAVCHVLQCDIDGKLKSLLCLLIAPMAHESFMICVAKVAAAREYVYVQFVHVVLHAAPLNPSLLHHTPLDLYCNVLLRHLWFLYSACKKKYLCVERRVLTCKTIVKYLTDVRENERLCVNLSKLMFVYYERRVTWIVQNFVKNLI